MVTYTEKHGIKPTARFFHTHPDTVRKWFYRFKELGYPGLEDMSRRPHNSPNQASETLKEHLVKLKSKYKRIGAEQIKTLENVPVSPKTMRKYNAREKLDHFLSRNKMDSAL